MCLFSAKGQATGRERLRDTLPTQPESGEYDVLFVLASYSFAWGFQCPHRSGCLWDQNGIATQHAGQLVESRVWPGERIARESTVGLDYKSAPASTGPHLQTEKLT